MKNKKLLILIIVFISIGFAFLTASLTINGNVKFADSTFNVYLDNVELKDSTAINTNLNLNDDKSVITANATLQKPGDNFNFSFNVINGGTIEAVLDNFTVSGLPDNLKNYFTYTLTYDFDKSTISRNDILYAGQARKINFNIEYNYDIDSIPEVDNLSLEIRLNYINPKKLSKTTEWNYSYSGTEQIFYVPKTGTYKLETWGAQGGSINNTKIGGYGGYSYGIIDLNENSKLYINVGGAGGVGNNDGCNVFYSGLGGYNGGGGGGTSVKYNLMDVYYASGTGGGGATHIATSSGLLSTFENKQDELLIVAGGGGGLSGYIKTSNPTESIPGSGGGYKGNDSISELLSGQINTSKGGTQSEGYLFGQGDKGRNGTLADWGAEGNGGAGGGYYGGITSKTVGAFTNNHGSGGSGYIGNSKLTNKEMYCYNCEQSSETNTKTILTNNVSEIPTSQYAKIGNGYVKITYIEQ